MRILLMHSPSAGHDQPAREDLLAAVQKAGHAVLYLSTKEAPFTADMARGFDVVAVAGGDGTVGKIALALEGQGIPVAVLPFGTANNIARTLGLSGDLQALVDRWAGAERRVFDVGVARGPWGETLFVESVGWGAFAQVVAAVARDKEAGAEEDLDSREEELARDRRLLRDTVAAMPARPLQVRVDGEDLPGRYLLAEVVNTGHTGPNLILAPGADPGDGFLDLVLVPEAGRAVLGAYLACSLKGEAPPPVLPVRRGSRVELSWDGSAVHLDGLIWPQEEPAGLQAEAPATPRIEITLRPAAVTFLA
jgi:diacylglycerol kinase family enzyme